MSIDADIDALQDAANALATFDADDDIAAGLAMCGNIRDLLPEIATAFVERGVRKGLSQRRMALLLGVPASALRGAKREFAT
jgi:hypothetical protein